MDHSSSFYWLSNESKAETTEEKKVHFWKKKKDNNGKSDTIKEDFDRSSTGKEAQWPRRKKVRSQSVRLEKVKTFEGALCVYQPELFGEESKGDVCAKPARDHSQVKNPYPLLVKLPSDLPSRCNGLITPNHNLHPLVRLSKIRLNYHRHLNLIAQEIASDDPTLPECHWAGELSMIKANILICPWPNSQSCGPFCRFE